MATVKIKFRASLVEGKEGTLFFQVIHNRVARQIKSEYKLYNDEWNEILSDIVISDDVLRKRYLQSLQENIRFEVKRIEQIIHLKDECKREYRSEDVVAIYNKKLKGKSLYGFLQETIQKLVELDNIRTSQTYKSTLNSFMYFMNGEDVLLKDLNSDMIEKYEAYLKHKGSALNTISFYMRTLRAAYNRAVEKGLADKKVLFKRVYTSIDKTAKRAIPPAHITKLKELELCHLPNYEFARDMFLFSFYTRGMSFIDIAYLKKNDIKNGELVYRRRKTGQTLHIKWEKCMAELAEKYTNKDNDYLLDIIKNIAKDERKQYIETLGNINRWLKKIAVMADLSCNLTMYVARHSWASAAKIKRIPLSVISEGMGHENEMTTQIYLASLDTSIIDKANRLILNSI